MSDPLRGPLKGAKVWALRDDATHHEALRMLGDDFPIAYDVETTGVDYHDEIRLVQFGNQTDAFVFDPHEWPELVRHLALRHHKIAHNAPFDALHLAKFTGIPVAKILATTTDTMILAHLVDPRDKLDGGTGKGLKELAAYYVDPESPDGQTALKARFKELGFKIADGFAEIDLWDPTFVLYAGLDVILTARLLGPLMHFIDKYDLANLSDFDHQVQAMTASMTERGMAVDVDYSCQLVRELEAQASAAEQRAILFGVNNVNSTAQVAEALLVRGVELTETTPSGAWKVDRTILEALDDELAQLVLEAKGARKAISSWVEPIIEHGRRDGRVHPRIKTLAARTSRMSITDPPLQQLPSTDHHVRSCLIADPGMSLIACDFSQIEFRVLAALSSEPSMIRTFEQGGDLHSATAARLFGEDFTKAHRKLAKGVGFGQVYGGGADTLSRQAGVSKLEARKAMAAFNRAFPRVKRWSASLTDKVTHGEPIVTLPTNRRIPIERRFGYRATNYMIQGLAADLFKGSLLELERLGLADQLLIPVHDEIIAQAPTQEAEEFAHAVAEAMSGEFGPVPIVAEAEVIGTSWGDAYRQEPHAAHR